MSESNPNDIWQVEVGGQIYDAPFAELRDWIAEGSLQPGDLVRKRNHRWIEARKVSTLFPFFDAKAKGRPMPEIKPEIAPPDGPALDEAEPTAAEVVVEVPSPPNSEPVVDFSARFTDPSFCSVHHERPSAFLCGDCGKGFCRECPKAYGGTVRICRNCGGLCKPFNEVRASLSETEFREAAVSEGFGINDFFNAIAHPFKFKASLFFGALMFMAFSLGQSATAMGGIYMAAGAIFCLMLANMLTFGVLANTVRNFSHGRLGSNFMPEFEDFSLWEDVIHPLFLSIGVYISSFGPFIITLIIGIYLIASSVSSHMDAVQSDLEKLPGTHYYPAQKTMKQSEAVKDVLGNISNQHNELLQQQQELAAGNTNANFSTDPESREQEELWAAAQQSRTAQLESVLGKTPETVEKENQAMIQAFLKLAAPFVVISAIFFLWGMFYFPAACAVAGYTRSFMATINPLVGLDTIKRLGGIYVKIFLMFLFIVIALVITESILKSLFAAFNMPGMGNMPAKAIVSLITFYFSVVFSCIIGYALFKASDRLRLRP